MKKSAIFLLAVLVFAGISSCEKTKDKINDATEFDMNYSTEFTIPSTTLSVPAGSSSSTLQPIDFNTPEINTSSKSKFASESTAENLIDEIKMTKFNISNEGGNLDYLKSLSIYLKTSNLGDVLVASKTNISKGVSSIDADLNDINIREYIFKDKIQFKINITLITGQGSSGDQKLKTSQTMHVKGKRL